MSYECHDVANAAANFPRIAVEPKSQAIKFSRLEVKQPKKCLARNAAAIAAMIQTIKNFCLIAMLCIHPSKTLKASR